MPAPWFRSEQGEPLSSEQGDENLQYLIDLVAGVEGGAATPVGLSGSIIQDGLAFTFGMTNAEVTDPVTLPVIAPQPRGFWEPATAYFTYDLVRVRGVGYYLVLEDHTSGVTFTPGVSYAFQYHDQQVQLPLYISDTNGELTLTRALHLNRLLVFLSSCDVTVDPDDWLEGDQVHGMLQVDGGIVEIRGSTALPVRPPDGDSSNISTLGGTWSMVYLAQLDIMAIFGRLDPEVTV